MPKKDKITPELRAVEKEVDEAYLDLPIFEETIPDAVWSLLSTIEVRAQGFHMAAEGIEDAAGFVDNLVNLTKYPMNWIFKTCKPVKDVYKRSYDQFEMGRELEELGFEYITFETIYTLATRGVVNLELAGTKIIVTKLHDMDFRYQAYGLVRKIETEKEDIGEAIEEYKQNAIALQNESEPLKIINPRNISVARVYLKTHFDRLQNLPGEWEFLNFTIEEIRQVMESLHAMMFLHKIAVTRKYGAQVKTFFENIVYIATEDELIARMTRYSKVDQEKVKEIIELLSFGSHGQKLPDPALQPIIKVAEDNYLLSPTLITSSSFERNLISLLNKIPETRDQYLMLTDLKEGIMQDKIIKSLGDKYEYFTGEIPGVKDIPDIDLAIIDNKSKTIFFCELKYLLGPAEPREVIEKSEEIAKGIAQAQSILDSFHVNRELFLQTLEIEGEYDAVALVISEDFIGQAYVQSDDIPVLEREHFQEYFVKYESLAELAEILIQREYLPVENEDFYVDTKSAKIDKYSVQWEGVAALKQ